MQKYLDTIRHLPKRGLWLFAAAAAVPVLVIMPLPGLAVDALLAANLAFSLALFLLSLVVERPARLGAFPAVIILSSLVRVILCLVAFRAALSGELNTSFAGALALQVMGEEHAILTGLAVLGITFLIAYVVINVGVSRLAEVSARFALDALPGRQMAVDSALSGGRVEPAEGMRQAAELLQESAFYGGMDGASRFLRGDLTAVALVTALTPAVLAATGTAELSGALIVPAVGLGLVIVIPVVLAGAAAAVMMSRADGASSLAEVGSALVERPQVIGAAGAALIVLALVPGVPLLPVMAVASLAALAAWQGMRRAAAHSVVLLDDDTAGILRVELGIGLMALLVNNELSTELARMRTALDDELGFAVQPAEITDNEALEANEYALRLGERVIAEGLVRPGCRLAVPRAEGVVPPVGRETTAPWGCPATWVREEEEEAALAAGCGLLRPVQVICRHFTIAIRNHAHELLSQKDTCELLDAVRVSHPAVVAELEDAAPDKTAIRDVARLLLREKVMLGERVTLVAEMAAAWRQARTPADVADAIRPALRRSITRLVAPDGTATAAQVPPALEEELAESLDGHGLSPAMPAERYRYCSDLLHAFAEGLSDDARPGVLLCQNPRARRTLGALICENGVNLMALCAEELTVETILNVTHRFGTPSL